MRRTGMLAALVLPMVFALPVAAQALECHGTEPFWNLSIGDGKITLEDPEGKQRLKTVKALAASGRPEDVVRVYQTKSLSAPKRAVTIVVRNEGQAICSNGMGDDLFSYSAVVIRGDTVLEGCCKW